MLSSKDTREMTRDGYSHRSERSKAQDQHTLSALSHGCCLMSLRVGRSSGLYDRQRVMRSRHSVKAYNKTMLCNSFPSYHHAYLSLNLHPWVLAVCTWRPRLIRIFKAFLALCVSFQTVVQQLNQVSDLFWTTL